MKLDWNTEQKEQQNKFELFAKEELSSRPRLDHLDREAWNLCCAKGIMKTPLPADWGGDALGALDTVGCFEALGRGGADRGLLFALGAHLYGVVMPVALHASKELQQEWGKKLADGTVVGALVMTEPEGGSSLAKMHTVLEKDGDDYILNGEKVFITNGPDADVLLVIATETQPASAFSLTAFLIPADLDGITIERLEPTHGLATAPMGRVRLDNCRVSKDSVVGRPKLGLKVFNSAMQWERPCILAGAIGASERDIDNAVKYLKQREDSNGTILQHQSLAHRLAHSQVRVESSRWLLYRAAWSIDKGENATFFPSLTKYAASEALVENGLDMMRIYGGAGWLDKEGVATGFADMIGGLSASGSSDIQLNMVFSSMGQKKKR
jgi:alkylation response protein AidB-like acyl-CoA dehydrogenase